MAMLMGVVAAMPAEARALAGRGKWRVHGGFPFKEREFGDVRVACVQAGVGRDKARAAAEVLIRLGAKALGSAGIAGGLSPDLAPGCLLAAAWIAGPGPDAPKVRTHADFSERLARSLARRGLDAHLGGLACLDYQASDSRDKLRLFRETGALACDMESLGPAMAARDAGLSFFALKAVADPAHRTLPEAAAKGMDDRGRTRVLPVLAHLARKPGELFALIRLARDFNAALSALERAAPAMAEAAAGGLSGAD